MLEEVVWPSLGLAASRAPEKEKSLRPLKETSELLVGKYYALLIGVSQYENSQLNLTRPIKDVADFKKALSSYTFEDSCITVLLNPTREKIYQELFKLRKRVQQIDNVLIFYAGHGYWDEATHQGYWWPRDATDNNPSNWISNSDLQEQIRAIQSAHTLLISDACFSGGIFRTRSGKTDLDGAGRDFQQLYKMPSRRAITSGTLTTVPDESVFLTYLVKRLRTNQEKFLSSGQLFESFRLAVINNSNVVPQNGVIAETGDEGGDFIFIRR